MDNLLTVNGHVWMSTESVPFHVAAQFLEPVLVIPSQKPPSNRVESNHSQTRIPTTTSILQRCILVPFYFTTGTSRGKRDEGFAGENNGSIHTYIHVNKAMEGPFAT